MFWELEAAITLSKAEPTQNPKMRLRGRRPPPGDGPGWGVPLRCPQQIPSGTLNCDSVAAGHQLALVNSKLIFLYYKVSRRIQN